MKTRAGQAQDLLGKPLGSLGNLWGFPGTSLGSLGDTLGGQGHTLGGPSKTNQHIMVSEWNTEGFFRWRDPQGGGAFRGESPQDGPWGPLGTSWGTSWETLGRPWDTLEGYGVTLGGPSRKIQHRMASEWNTERVFRRRPPRRKLFSRREPPREALGNTLGDLLGNLGASLGHLGGPWGHLGGTFEENST